MTYRTCVWLRTFQSLKRKTKNQNGDAQSLLYLFSLAQSNADSRVSPANEIVGYYKKSTRRNGEVFNRRVQPRVGPACFRFFRPGKQSAANFIDVGMGGQPNGEFFLVFSPVYISRFFLPFPSYSL